MSSTQKINTTELRTLYRDTQLEVLRLKEFIRKTRATSEVNESLRLLEIFENNLKLELVERGEDI